MSKPGIIKFNLSIKESIKSLFVNREQKPGGLAVLTRKMYFLNDKTGIFESPIIPFVKRSFPPAGYVCQTRESPVAQTTEKKLDLILI